MPEKVLIDIQSDYEYVLGQAMGRVLDMQALFTSTDFLPDELDLIKEEMVSTAKEFAIQQGLGGGNNSKRISLLHYGQPKKNKFGTIVSSGEVYSIPGPGGGPTGNLISHIKGEVNGKTVTIYNDATNSRGQYYAGHIEFGFHDRGGNLVPARPFMRPAFYAVADASRGKIQGVMKRYLENIWNMDSLYFGYPITDKGNYRKFYEKWDNHWDSSRGRYTARAIAGRGRPSQGRLNEMRSFEGRMKQTIDRRGNHNIQLSRDISSRMGTKSGWRKDSNGQEWYKRDTRWTKGNSRSFSSKSHSITQRSFTKVDNGYRIYTARDGSEYRSRNEAIVYQKGSSEGIKKGYVEKISYTRNTPVVRSGRFGFKRRK